MPRFSRFHLVLHVLGFALTISCIVGATVQSAHAEGPISKVDLFPVAGSFKVMAPGPATAPQDGWAQVRRQVPAAIPVFRDESQLELPATSNLFP